MIFRYDDSGMTLSSRRAPSYYRLEAGTFAGTKGVLLRRHSAVRDGMGLET